MNIEQMANVAAIKRLCESAYETALAKGWWVDRDASDPVVLGSLLALIHSEVSEALEDVRNGYFSHYIDGNGKPCGLMSELADIAIRVFDLSEKLRLTGLCSQSLGEAIIQKMLYNDTRSYKHGNKSI